MIPLLTLILMLAAPVPENDPDVLILFANEATYRTSPALEARYQGRLEFVPGVGGQVGRIRLIVAEGDGSTQPYELHLPRPQKDLTAWVGQTVRLVGKNTEQGLWPGKLERVTVTGAIGRDGILARSPWQPASARRLQPALQTFVIRSGEQAGPLLGLSGANREQTATRLLAQQFRREEIDWKTQMVVCVAIGLKTEVEQLTIHRVVAKDGTLTVYYRMPRLPDMQAQGFGYPAETILVPRFDGAIRFVEEKDR